MDKAFSLKLSTGKCTDVYICEDIDSLRDRIALYGSNSLIVSDENTDYLVDNFIGNRVVLHSGEENKNYEGIFDIIDRALGLSLARDSVFIGVGGGVVCDMTSFSASIYMRGSRVVLAPTTLLSMVDASLGGKTGIDYRGYKNFIGTFYPAEDVLISSETLRTLSDREFLSGMGEVVKHALISGDSSLFDYLSANSESILSRDASRLLEMIRLSLLVKCQFLERDPEERLGIRSFLNLGHTFGHALETLTDYSVSHGEAVVFGIRCALNISERKGLLSTSSKDRALRLLSLFPFADIHVSSLEDRKKLVDITSKDKKRQDGRVRFVLLKGLGEPVLDTLEYSEILDAIV